MELVSRLDCSNSTDHYCPKYECLVLCFGEAWMNDVTKKSTCHDIDPGYLRAQEPDEM